VKEWGINKIFAAHHSSTKQLLCQIFNLKQINS